MAKFLNRERLKRKFAAMPRAVRKQVETDLITSAKELNSFQRRLVPVDKGTLATSIRYEVEQGAEFGVVVKAGGTPATRREVRQGSGEFTDEAPLVEFGTGPHRLKGKFAGALHPGTKPQPFFFGPYRASKKRIKSRSARGIGKAVRQIAGKK